MSTWTVLSESASGKELMVSCWIGKGARRDGWRWE